MSMVFAAPLRGAVTDQIGTELGAATWPGPRSTGPADGESSIDAI
jgi:hypothetical protein